MSSDQLTDRAALPEPSSQFAPSVGAEPVHELQVVLSHSAEAFDTAALHGSQSSVDIGEHGPVGAIQRRKRRVPECAGKEYPIRGLVVVLANFRVEALKHFEALHCAGQP